jgi:hypothetical protein
MKNNNERLVLIRRTTDARKCKENEPYASQYQWEDQSLCFDNWSTNHWLIWDQGMNHNHRKAIGETGL